MEAMKRFEAKAQIREAIFNILRTAMLADGRLVGIKGIYDGERVRGIPELPAIFVIREDETVTQQRIHQTMDYELSLLAIVTDDDPDVGMNTAEKWAAEASAIVQSNRTLGLKFVNDVKLTRSIPVSGPHTEGRRVASVDVIVVTYTIVQQ